VPNSAFAQQAETDLETVTDMFFDACLLDWPSESARWHHLAKRFQGGSQVHIQGTETDLRFSVEGRAWKILDGKINMPDGEILTAPINDSLNGTIRFEFPGVFGGRLIPDIVLAWRDGELVDARASQNEDYLHQILETDPGARRLGEFAFGVNPHITHFCKDILFDEKIGGTVHIALGRAYPECGGTNESAIHWDIVKDLRTSGTVSLDGKIIFDRGRFTEHSEEEFDDQG
jgi:aminopeptidase